MPICQISPACPGAQASRLPGSAGVPPAWERRRPAYLGAQASRLPNRCRPFGARYRMFLSCRGSDLRSPPPANSLPPLRGYNHLQAGRLRSRYSSSAGGTPALPAATFEFRSSQLAKLAKFAVEIFQAAENRPPKPPQRQCFAALCLTPLFILCLCSHYKNFLR